MNTQQIETVIDLVKFEVTNARNNAVVLRRADVTLMARIATGNDTSRIGRNQATAIERKSAEYGIFFQPSIATSRPNENILVTSDPNFINRLVHA